MNPREHQRGAFAHRGGNPFRGILMLVAAGIAFWRGWQIHHGHYAWMAYGLGALALGVAVWHLASGGRRSQGDTRW